MIRIGPLQVDLASRELFLDGQPVRIGSRAFDMLAVLIDANGALVSKSVMLEQVWPDTIVEENNLQVHMSALRKVLGESRNLIQTVSGRGYRLISREACAQQPPDKTVRDTAEDIASVHSVPHNLPANSSSLIGREQALSDVAQALASTRHVTLVGSGGIGKTRLAIEIARSLLAHFPEGVYLVPLACAVDANSVLAMFANSVGVSTASGPLTLARVSKELGERRVLFVLDNCEHVLGPAAELAEALLNVSPAIRILATSREPLRVVDEHLYWVASLDVPARDDQSQHVLQRSAVQLFLSRARAIDARFSSDDRSIHLTGTVCRRLDGIPLAIELAAARAAILGIETLADHLDDRFNMLTGGNRTALPRHQTLKATLDWSHALLDDAERATLRRLGVFVNSFTIDSAIAMVSDDGLLESDVIAALSGLVEKSLVVMQAQRGKASYRLLETTRAYALQKLDDNGERRLVTLNHARYFLDLLERDSSSDTHQAHQAHEAGAARVDPDRRRHRTREQLDDLRAALAWALSPKGDAALGETLAVKFVSLLYELSLVDECCVWARRALDAVETTHQGSRSPRHLHVRMQLLAVLGAALVYVNGPNRETLGIWAEVLALAIASGDQTFEARALWGMWNASQSSGAARNALGFAQRFASLAAQTGDTANGILACRLLGIASHYAGDQQEARASLDQFLQHTGCLQHRLPLGHFIDHGVVGRATFARLLGLQGARDQALRIAEACVAEACRQEQAMVTCYVLVEAEIPLALLAGQRRRAAQAIALLRDMSARVGLRVSHACCRCFDEYLHSLDDTSAQRVKSFRAALDDLEALEYAAPRAMLAAQYSLALGRAGQPKEGIAVVIEALAQGDHTGDQWYAAELRRVHAELLLMECTGQPPFGDAVTHAQASLSAALEESLAQGCRSLQLRAATSLGRLWHAQGRSAEALHLVKAACARLTEGHDWDDFKAAEELLRVATEACAPGRPCAGIETRMRMNADAAAASLDEPPPDEIRQVC
ncbi:winged helix-turn-helix domain-containing protein [Paraburkholderia sp. FT54]|uniref:winged helix-turn-helix domain-containing protein n=1 Tax=Paraburkholderia sp. FT54 TaxID=3074437 RepID=UPI00287811D6|nr:winged helix-turn-helix domain-containing protein [Paraburkholderia sp. FT54]WNC92476.1 winged helix-turn-helix domain-containing protein [Paraburkholderia sp. FT54]